MPKRPAGALLQNLPADAEGRTRRAAVYRAVLDAIGQGALVPGMRLPSARQLASEWRVARSAVDEAFAQLQDEGWLERRVGAGTTVARRPPGAPPADPAPPNRGPNPAARRVLAHFAPYMAQTRSFELPRQQFHPPVLHPRGWPQDVFPLALWRRLVRDAYGDEWRDHLGYGPADGLPALREAIARHVALTRSVRCKPEQVVVVNSAMQGVETVARVLLSPGDAVWVEDPGHPSLPLLLEMLHARAVGVPLDEQGLNVAAGRERAPQARLVYLHPLTQYPLGQPTAGERALELLQWADDQGAWILEGCFNDEIVYRSPATPALQSLDGNGRVLVMGTFEGVIFPALRVAYLIVPERLIDVFVAARGLMGDHTQVATQLALAAFIGDGHFATHLRQLTAACRDRRDALRTAVRRHLPAEAILGPTGSGFHASLHLPARWPDTEVVRQIHRRRVGGEALSTRCWQATGRNGIILGYGGAGPAAIEAAVRDLSQVLDPFTGR